MSQPQLEEVQPKCKDAHHLDLLERCKDSIDTSTELPECTCRDLSAVGRHAEVLSFAHVLSESACQALCKTTEELVYSFWNADESQTKFRNAQTVEVIDPVLAAALWAKMQPHVPETVTLDEDDDRCDRGMSGTWRAQGIYEHLLFARYDEQGHFSPHTDGYTILDFNRRSYYTVIVYLNDCADGGGTVMFAPGSSTAFALDEHARYHWKDADVIGHVPCKTGTAVAFFQDLPHEGEPVGARACKYIIRTDVIYQRDPPICDTPEDREAYAMYRRAELLEADGNVAEAAALFRRCCRVSPDLASHLGL